MRVFCLLLFLVIILPCFSQIPGRYKLKQIKGTIYDRNGQAIGVSFYSRRKLILNGCKDQDVDLFLRTLLLGRHGSGSWNI